MSRIELHVGTCTEQSLRPLDPNLLTQEWALITEEGLESYELFGRTETINARNMNVRAPGDNIARLQKDGRWKIGDRRMHEEALDFSCVGMDERIAEEANELLSLIIHDGRTLNTRETNVHTEIVRRGMR